MLPVPGVHESRTDRPRLEALDALRALAAWLVLVSHVGFWTGRTGWGGLGGVIARGDAGVAVFFALSAYLLSGPLVRAALGGASAWSLRSYAARRSARILPGYLLALAAVLVVATTLGGAAATGLDPWSVAAHLLLLQGLTGGSPQAFTQTWSLTSEVSFYLALPLGAAVLVPRLRRRPPAEAARLLLRTCLALAVLGVAAQAVAAALAGPGAPPWAGALATSAPGHGAWFAAGLAAAVLVESERVGADQPSAPTGSTRRATVRELARTSPGTLTLAALVCWLVAATPVAGPRDLAAPSVPEAVTKEILYAAAAGAAVLAGAARGSDQGWARGLLGRVASHLGALSYGVFLWHLLVLQVLFAALDLQLFAAPFGPVLLVVTVGSLGLAQLSWVLLERPVLRRVRRATAAVPDRAQGARY